MTNYLQRNWSARPQRLMKNRAQNLENRIKDARFALNIDNTGATYGLEKLILTGALGAAFAGTSGLGFTASAAIYSFGLNGSLGVDLGGLLNFVASAIAAIGSLLVYSNLSLAFGVLQDSKNLVELEWSLEEAKKRLV